ncbi:MAG TPA: 6-carboxyhexanoate--CoA ligase [Candidatus Sulfobium mesophilum]|nr:6-carboxyhexanoate--CoA ligase [Candidatus Sulfobium mesophilum]
MVSIRMRASIRTGKKNRKKSADLHISGAEGIYDRAVIGEVVEAYIRRASGHSRGRPDRIDIKIEKITTAPKKIRSLPVTTITCRSANTAQRHIRELLLLSGVSETAVQNAVKVAYNPMVMRGASLMCAQSGRRVEPDRQRGIRASRLGISHNASDVLSRILDKAGINSDTVREALVLASKVACCKEVIAELCVSDDPDYTTGYVSSRKFGYVRVPHIKRRGQRCGGRVFFVRENSALDNVIAFLEKKHVLVDDVSECLGVLSINEITGKHHI